MSIVIILIVIFIVYIYWIGNRDTDNLKTVSQGTQVRYNNISIGLTNVEDSKAWLMIKKEDDVDESLKKVVIVNDKFEAFGHTIEIKSVDKNWFGGFVSGSGTGTIKLIIK